MRILFLSMALLCASLSSFAQKFQVKWGLEYKKEGGMFSRDFLLGSDGKYFYVLSDPRG